jgi:hypothetical protein
VSPSVGKATPNSRRERNGDTEVASRAHSDWLEQRLEAGSLHSSGRDCRRGRGGGKAKNPTGPWGADDLDGQKRGDPRRRGRGPPTHEAKVVRRWRANAPARSCGAPGRFTNLPLTRVIAEAVASANPRTGEPVPMLIQRDPERSTVASQPCTRVAERRSGGGRLPTALRAEQISPPCGPASICSTAPYTGVVERKLAAVLFVDLVDSTELATRGRSATRPC